MSTPVPEEANLVIGHERGGLEWGSSSDSWGLDAVVRVVEERERERGKERESNAKRVHMGETG